MSLATIDAVWRWLMGQPDLCDELGIEDRSDLSYLGSGGRSEVVYIGDQTGRRLVLKVTTSGAQAGLSRLAMEQQPVGVVPVLKVIETEDEPLGLPELPAKGEEPWYETRRWGVVEELSVPVEELPRLGDIDVAGEPAMDLYLRYGKAEEGFLFDYPVGDAAAEEWRRDMLAAREWVEQACEEMGSQPSFDFHPGNWGIDPEAGDIRLIDLGQCYEVTPNSSSSQQEALDRLNALPRLDKRAIKYLVKELRADRGDIWMEDSEELSAIMRVSPAKARALVKKHGHDIAAITKREFEWHSASYSKSSRGLYTHYTRGGVPGSYDKAMACFERK